MPIDLPPDLLAATQNPGSTATILWLWELTLHQGVDPDPTIVVDLVANPEPITIGTTTFWPWAIQPSTIESTASGDLPTLQLTVDNRSRWLMPYLHAYQAFAGQRVSAWIVNAQAPPASLSVALQQTFEIRTAEANAEAIVFRLEIPNLWRIKLPIDRYRPDRCDVPDFGGAECGYIRNDVAAYSTCGRTVDDCSLRGQDESARRIPVRHPRRFGGFRGVAVAR